MKIDDFINRKELSDRLDEDIDLLREMIDLFIKESPGYLSNIENSIKDQNSEKLRKSAHTLKGSVSNFSAKRAFDFAYELENIGRNNELDKAESSFENLKNEINQVYEALNLLKEEDSIE